MKVNDSPVQLCESQKHLGVILGKHPNFHGHIKRKSKICSKLISIIKTLPLYYTNIIPVSNHSSCNTRTQPMLELSQFFSRTKSFSNTFFSLCIKEWNKLDAKIRNLPFVSKFIKLQLIYFLTDGNSIFNIHNPIGIKLLDRHLILVT